MRQRRLVGLAIFLAAAFLAYQRLHPARLGSGARASAEFLLALGAILVAGQCLRTGRSPLFGAKITRDDTPTAFWFVVLLNAVFAIAFVVLGLRDIIGL